MRRIDGLKQAKVARLRQTVISLQTTAARLAVYSGEAVWCARALFVSKVDGFVPRAQRVNLRKVGRAV